MIDNKPIQINKTFPTKKVPQTQRQAHSNYESLGLWVSFFWSIITLYLSENSASGLLSLSTYSVLFATSVFAQVPRTVIPEFRVNSNSIAGNKINPSLVSFTSGDWLVAWVNYNNSYEFDIYAQRFSTDGDRLGGEVQVNTNAISSNLTPALINLSSGGWAVAWRGGPSYDPNNVYIRFYSSNGIALGNEIKVNTNITSNQGDAALVSLASGDWVVAWADLYQVIHARRFAAAGSAIGPEFRLTSNATNDQQSVAIISLISGDWVVAWKGVQNGNSDIYARLYAGNGNALGQEFRVNTNTINRQFGPALLSLASGDWVAVWVGDQTGDIDIYAKRYSSNGTALGNEFRVNTVTAGTQFDPALVSFASGEWIVTWYGDQEDGNSDIYAQRFADDGRALGQEFRVNTNPTGSQRVPAVVKLGSGNWVVAWETQDLSSGIYATVFSSTEFISTTSSSTPNSTKKFVTTTSPTQLLTSETTAFKSITPLASPTTVSETILSKTFVTSSTASSTENETPWSSVSTTSTFGEAVVKKTLTGENSGESGIVIGAAVGAGGVALIACLGAMGFYTCRKKPRAKNLESVAGQEVRTPMKIIANDSHSQLMGEQQGRSEYRALSYPNNSSTPSLKDSGYQLGPIERFTDVNEEEKKVAPVGTIYSAF